jgi:3-hydroxyacyl-CoA dehydrogenase/3a,7a,12a-trihydroxy-5b-cholest-24-enoyl-CoA hydratase
MAASLRYDERVAIVTGAGGGLGRMHALTLAQAGAKLVINDLGGSTDGAGQSSSAADKVVEEIRALGGEAVANYDSVENGAAIVKTAIDAFGRVDIVVNNAGILRDASFHKMSQQDWDLVNLVHLKGAQSVSHAAWPYMREQNYGRIIMTTSAAGIYGNFGQANYGAAKLGMLGLANTLAEEGRSKNIRVNTIAPVAASRMTENILPPQLLSELKPEYISPLVAWLCHEDCEETKGLFEVGAGYMAKLRWERTLGHAFKLGQAIAIEDVAKKFDKICDFEKSEHPQDVNTAIGAMLTNITNPSLGGNEFIDLDEATGQETVLESSYDERDLSIYALGVGAGNDPLDATELPMVYEGSNKGFKALASYAALPQLSAMLELAKTGGKLIPGLNYGFDRSLHGEQYTEIKQLFNPSAKLTHTYKLKQAFDKNPHAVVVIGVDTKDESGEVVAYNEMSVFVRDGGGWGGDRGPSGDENVPPSRKADATISEHIPENQALLYRLSGDWNPLHADPQFAQAFGFDKPILHGMCTHGYVTRHVVKAFCENDPRFVKSIKVRFAQSVFPGETIETSMWKESDTRIVFEARVKERDEVVIQNAVIELYEELPVRLVNTAKDNSDSATVEDKIISDDIFNALDEFVKSDAKIAKSTQTVFQFSLSGRLAGEQSHWVLDLKNESGSCYQGTDDNSDVSLELSEDNLVAMLTGQADAQKLYFAGDMVIGGNVMASNKLEAISGLDVSLIEAKKAQRLAGGADNTAEDDSLQAADIFEAINKHLTQNDGQAAKKAQTVFQFDISEPESHFVLDLKNGQGSCIAGATEDADVNLGVSEENLLAMFVEGADAQQLYFAGSLTIGGNVMASSKLEALGEIDKSLYEQAKQDRLAGKANDKGDSQAAAKAPEREATASAIFAATSIATKTLEGTLQINVQKPESNWTLKGSDVNEGVTDTADAIITLTDSDLEKISKGEATAASLFQKGKIQVEGDMSLARQFSIFENVLVKEKK